MKIVVKKETCIGCGSCAQANPQMFQLGKEGTSEVIGDYSGLSLEELKEMATYCPVEAIEIYDDEGNKLFPQV